MSRPSRPTRSRVIDDLERSVTPQEAAAYLAVPISEDEREEAVTLIRWFRRRYPTGAERLAYVRRAYRRWVAGRAER